MVHQAFRNRRVFRPVVLIGISLSRRRLIRRSQHRDAATRAELAALAERMHTLESEQQTQLKRIAQLQAQLDEALRLLKSLTR